MFKQTVTAFLLVWSSQIALNTNAEVFSSVVKLKVLANLELVLLSSLGKFIQSQNGIESRDIGGQNMNDIIRFVVETEHKLSQEGRQVGNPVNSYQLVHRFLYEWRQIKDILKMILRTEHVTPESETFANKFLHTAKFIQDSEMWPDTDDLQGASLGLLRIVEIYQVPLYQLARGNLLGKRTMALETTQCLSIADVAQDMEMDWEAVKWYNYTISILGTDAASQHLLTKAHMSMAAILYKLGRPDLSADSIQQLIVKKNGSGIHDNQLQTELRNYLQKSSNKPVLHPLIRPPPKWIGYYNFEKLCRAQLQLTRSDVGGKDSKGATKSNARISQSTWLPAEDKMSEVLCRRIKLITGLQTDFKLKDTNSELFQVINYGIGGLHLPHHDYVSYYRKAKFEDVPLFQNSGDRIATVILYLSDVLMGGATVFRNLTSMYQL
ncbi:prolyl 4-hydroxylase subunit alpha-2-like isoform X2 [Octopus sinensis]|uniref:Prolyl 4-hydroxylase subunit alpha-2-like isoform X2 n=1 Tax=Octopus sinensis TaxID=2607531 RepID=A0A7E6F3A8_9MOLL|nr:prolyl 4-hydroxylase subunit alpha-2-like isoform X2 [Octopus sinensis]